MMFQSLFSWNLPSEAFATRVHKNDSLVSILVFLELALRGIDVNDESGNQIVSILVFLELALRVSVLKGIYK